MCLHVRIQRETGGYPRDTNTHIHSSSHGYRHSTECLSTTVGRHTVMLMKCERRDDCEEGRKEGGRKFWSSREERVKEGG